MVHSEQEIAVFFLIKLKFRELFVGFNSVKFSTLYFMWRENQKIGRTSRKLFGMKKNHLNFQKIWGTGFWYQEGILRKFLQKSSKFFSLVWTWKKFIKPDNRSLPNEKLVLLLTKYKTWRQKIISNAFFLQPRDTNTGGCTNRMQKLIVVNHYPKCLLALARFIPLSSCGSCER